MKIVNNRFYFFILPYNNYPIVATDILIIGDCDMNNETQNSNQNSSQNESHQSNYSNLIGMSVFMYIDILKTSSKEEIEDNFDKWINLVSSESDDFFTHIMVTISSLSENKSTSSLIINKLVKLFINFVDNNNMEQINLQVFSKIIDHKNIDEDTICFICNKFPYYLHVFFRKPIKQLSDKVIDFILRIGGKGYQKELMNYDLKPEFWEQLWNLFPREVLAHKNCPDSFKNRKLPKVSKIFNKKKNRKERY